MKNLFLALLAISVLTFAACGDDDDNNVALNADNIVGTWNLTAYDSDLNVELVGISSDRTTSTISNSTATITFAENGTWTSTGGYTISSTTASDGMTETEEVTDGVGSGTYTVTNGALTFTGLDADANEESNLNSVEFSVNNFAVGSILDLSSNVMETITDPVFGLEIKIDGTIDMTLEQ